MGNELSKQARNRPSNRISKPKTNRYSKANFINAKVIPLLNRHNSVSTNGSPTKFQYSTAFSEAGEAGEAAEEEEEPKKWKRISLFRLRSSHQKATLDLERDPATEKYLVDQNPAVDSPVRQWPRFGKTRAQSMPPPPHEESPCDPIPEIRRPPARSQRMSLQHVPYNQLNPRLSLVAELPSPEPGYNEGAKRFSNFQQLNMLQQMPESPVEPERTRYSLIRRRSLQQPGIATRNSSFTENDPRQTLPSQIQPLEELHRHHDPSKLSSFRSGSAAVNNDEDSSSNEVRAITPADLDYGHIGAYKLGSLRITNGAASPEASSDGRPGSGEDEGSVGLTQTWNANGEHIPGQFDGASSHTPKPWMVRSNSPLRQAQSLEDPSVNLDLPTPAVPPSSFALFNFPGADEIFNNTQSPTKSLELAQEYMQDLALSPFSFDNSRPGSPQFEATSKNTATEDGLFSLEPDTPVLSDRAARSFDSGYVGSLPAPSIIAKGPHDLGLQPLAKADSGYSSNLSLRSFRTREGSVFSARETSPAPPKDPISRAPSGRYSIDSAFPQESISRVPSSRYSTSSALPRESISRVPSSKYSVDSAFPTESISRAPSSRYSMDSALPRESMSLAPSSTYSVNSATTPNPAASQISSSTIPDNSTAPSHFKLRIQRSLPALPRKGVPMQPSLLHPPAPQRHDSAATQPLPRKPITQSHASPDILKHVLQRGWSNMRHPREGSAGSFGSLVPSPGRAPRWRANSRLNKQPQPQSIRPQPVFTVQALRTPSERFNISSPSAETRRHLEQRVQRFPVAAIPNTYAGNFNLRHTASKETLGTIFSVGSLEMKAEMNAARLQGALPAIPMQNTILEHPNRKPDFSRRNTYQAPARKPLPQYSHSGYKIPTRKSYMQERNSAPVPAPAPVQWNRAQQMMDFETHVTSFDTISSALGSGPYNIPGSTLSRQNLSNERAKSMTAEFEANASIRFSYASQRDNNDLSRSNTITRTSQSYNDFTNYNGASVLTSGNANRGHSRGNSREYPPQAQGNRRSWGAPPSVPMEAPVQAPVRAADDDRRNSFLARPQKTKSSPPVSMQTQRRSVLASTPSQVPETTSNQTNPNPNPNPNHQETPPTRPPSAPAATSTLSRSQTSEGQAAQASAEEFWAQTRKSIEMSRPGSANTTASTKNRQTSGLGIKRADTAPPTPQVCGKKEVDIGSRASLDGYAERLRSASGKRNGDGFDTTQYQQDWVDYDHTFGGVDAFSSMRQRGQPEEEYYEMGDGMARHGEREMFHQRQMDTKDMIGFGRWDVGLGYDHEDLSGRLVGANGSWVDGVGMGGRGQSTVGSGYYAGVDLSDVPVLA